MFADPMKALMNFAAVLAIALYAALVVFLGVPAWHAGLEEAVKYLSALLTAIGGALATFFGAAFGLNQVKAAAGPAALTDRMAQVATLTWIQAVAAWVYFVSLLVAAALWGVAGFSTAVPEAVRSLALSLPGVLVGILTIALSLRRQ